MIMNHEAAVAYDGFCAFSFQPLDSFADPLFKELGHDAILTRHEIESGDLFVYHVARERVGIADITKSVVKVWVVEHEHSDGATAIPGQVLFHIHGRTGGQLSGACLAHKSASCITLQRSESARDHLFDIYKL